METVKIKKIERDLNRFRKIVRGKIRKDLRKYMKSGELIGKKGRELVSIPIPRIDIPRFRYGKNDEQGVGQGDGGEGDPVDGASGAGKAGDQPGEHLLEAEVTLEELAEILGEELELPRIRPKGQHNISSTKLKYTGISRVGPESLRHFKRTYKQALKRQLITGLYDPRRPRVIPIREDVRYRSWKEWRQPQSAAVIIYMMDVSGSMGNDQKEIVRLEAFWIDTWLKSQYREITTRYIIHDATAREVDEQTFYHTKESGGTRISTAYSLAGEIVRKDYPPDEWNIYYFHFSDGDNWGGGDTEKCIKLLRDDMLTHANLFCYGQVESPYGSGQFIKDLQKNFGDEENLITSEIKNKDGIYDSIKTFLGKGR